MEHPIASLTMNGLIILASIVRSVQFRLRWAEHNVKSTVLRNIKHPQNVNIGPTSQSSAQHCSSIWQYNTLPRNHQQTNALFAGDLLADKSIWPALYTSFIFSWEMFSAHCQPRCLCKQGGGGGGGVGCLDQLDLKAKSLHQGYHGYQET